MITWRNIDTVILDMDGTLLDLNYDNHFWLKFVPTRYAELHNISLEAANAVLIPQFRAMEGKLEWYCLDYWSRELKLDIPAMKAEIAELISVLPHVTDFLQWLKTLDKTVILATNAHRKSLHLKLERTCLNLYFDHIISSHDLGHPKETEEFWRLLRCRHPFDPARTLLVDDSSAVLASARHYGIGHIVAVCKNDSASPPKQFTDFWGIMDFRELMSVDEIVAIHSGLG
ncbi:MAG: GMP/IMP nucleotidase [Methylococcaceae bacterium]|jgi:HAD superfamily hydrolase (TIGR01509 family)